MEKNNFGTLFGTLLHGGDYNPEQWLHSPEILETDIAYFKKAHINEVTLGVFSWSMLEPEEGVFQFQWMEEMIQKLYRNGISVILATPSGARPKKRPETTRPSSPSRTMSALARVPMSSFNAESSADLPAPVSPVRTVRPAHGSSVASRMSARFCT